jgi:Tfp pilus assembly protein PilF
MGQAWVSAGAPGAAAGYFRKAIRVDPRDAQAYAALGKIYLDRGEVADAHEIFATGLKYRPDSGKLARLLARAQRAQGNPERAAETLRRLLERVPDATKVHLARARLARERGAWSEALASYRAVLDLAARGQAREQQASEARRYARGLQVLVGTLDPVRAVPCDGDTPRARRAVRRALAECE